MLYSPDDMYKGEQGVKQDKHKAKDFYKNFTN